MRVNTEGAPAYTIAYCHLGFHETLHLERGAMAAMTTGIAVSGGVGGNVVQAAMRKLLAKESLFMGTYTAQVEGAWVAAVSKYPGDIREIRLSEHDAVRIEQGALLGFTDGVDVSVRAAGLSRLVMREGATTLRASGPGQLLISAYGAIQEFDLQDNFPIIVDTGHLIASDEHVELSVGTLGGVTASQLSGEGLVCRATGPGRVWIQTRSVQHSAGWFYVESPQNGN